MSKEEAVCDTSCSSFHTAAKSACNMACYVAGKGTTLQLVYFIVYLICSAGSIRSCSWDLSKYCTFGHCVHEEEEKV